MKSTQTESKNIKQACRENLINRSIVRAKVLLVLSRKSSFSNILDFSS